MTENTRTNAIDTPTLFDDVLKTSKSASQFGPLRIYRVEEVPSDDQGRNGDLAIVDNTAVSSTEIASSVEPSQVSFCQKIPMTVPDGENRETSTNNGADLVANDQFSIDKQTLSSAVTVTLPTGDVFVKQASETVNDAEIDGISAKWTNTTNEGSITDPYAAPGDSITVNGVTVTFTGGFIDHIVAKVNQTFIPYIIASNSNNRLSITHQDGGTVTVGGANAAGIFGTGTVSGGLLTITNDDGYQVDLADVVGTPLATMGFPTTIAASPTKQGGTWRSFANGDVDVEDEGTFIGAFDTFNFVGAGVTVTDVGSGKVKVDIPGAAGAGGINITTINGQPTLTLVDTTRGNKILSVAETNFIYAEPNLADLDWFKIGDAADSTTGYITPFQGTIVSASYHCSDDNGQTKELDLYINGVLNTTLFTTPGTSAQNSAQTTTLNIDISQGDRLQMRAGTTGTAIADTLVTLWVKWRG